MNRLALAPAAVLIATVTLTACAASQGGAATLECGPVQPGLTAEQVEARVACQAGRPAGEAAAACRGVDAYATQVSAEVLGEAVRYVLGAGAREDGAWLAGLLGRVQGDEARLGAVVAAMETGFRPEVHGNGFSAAVGTPAQAALGAQLGQRSGAFARSIVSFSLASGLPAVAAAAPAVVESLPADDPGLRSRGEQLDSSPEPKSASDRAVLVRTGRWTARDVLECQARTRRDCADWSGDSPLTLLGGVRLTSGGTAGQLVTLLRGDQVDRRSAAAIATAVSSGEYPNQDAMINALLNEMTDAAVPTEVRAGLASTVTPRVCESSKVASFFARVAGLPASERRRDDSVWSTFVRGCAEQHWDARDLLRAVASGSDLGVSEGLRASFEARLKGVTSGLSCEEVAALADGGIEIVSSTPVAAAAPVVAARVGSAACSASLRPRIERLAADVRAHGEARIEAIGWLVDAGDRGACAKIDSALAWRDPETRQGPGEWATARAAALRAKCQ